MPMINFVQKYGHFRYTREILFSNTENCDESRYTDILMSLGSIQTIIEDYKNEIKQIFNGKDFSIDFSYRMRIGVK